MNEKLSAKQQKIIVLIIDALNREIIWCNDNPDKAFTAEYRKGFVNGIIQSKYIIGEIKRISPGQGE